MHTRIAQRKWPFAVGKKRFSLFFSFTPDVSNFHSTYKFLRVLISSTWQHKTDKTGSCFAVFIIVVTGEKLMSREFEPFIFFLFYFILFYFTSGSLYLLTHLEIFFFKHLRLFYFFFFLFIFFFIFY